MTDWLEELLLEQEPDGEEPLWWKDRRVRPVPGEQLALTQPELTVGRTETAQEQASKRISVEERLPEPAGEWTARELERIRRVARRAVRESAPQERVKHSGHRVQPFAEASTSAVLKGSPAAGRQGLTAQIDMQFRRDARRYDGRLGLL